MTGTVRPLQDQTIQDLVIAVAWLRRTNHPKEEYFAGRILEELESRSAKDLVHAIIGLYEASTEMLDATADASKAVKN